MSLYPSVPPAAQVTVFIDHADTAGRLSWPSPARRGVRGAWQGCPQFTHTSMGQTHITDAAKHTYCFVSTPAVYLMSSFCVLNNRRGGVIFSTMFAIYFWEPFSLAFFRQSSIYWCFKGSWSGSVWYEYAYIVRITEHLLFQISIMSFLYYFNFNFNSSDKSLSLEQLWDESHNMIN